MNLSIYLNEVLKLLKLLVCCMQGVLTEDEQKLTSEVIHMTTELLLVSEDITDLVRYGLAKADSETTPILRDFKDDEDFQEASLERINYIVDLIDNPGSCLDFHTKAPTRLYMLFRNIVRSVTNEKKPVAVSAPEPIVKIVAEPIIEPITIEEVKEEVIEKPIEVIEENKEPDAHTKESPSIEVQSLFNKPIDPKAPKSSEIKIKPIKLKL